MSPLPRRLLVRGDAAPKPPAKIGGLLPVRLAPADFLSRFASAALTLPASRGRALGTARAAILRALPAGLNIPRFPLRLVV
jgi:hypothetical protein